MPITEGWSAADSIFSGAASAAPGLGVTVCSVPVSPGIYQVEVNIILTGTAETQLNNGLLAIPSTPPTFAASIPTLTGLPYRLTIPRVRVTQTGIIAFKTILAATAGSVYMAYISATRIG